MDGELIKTWWPIVVVAGGLVGLSETLDGR